MKILVTIIYSVGLFNGALEISTVRSNPMPAAACEKFAQKYNDLYAFRYAYCIDAEEPAP